MVLIFLATLQDQDQDLQARSHNIDSGEILDEIITRSRGEVRRLQSPKLTSSTPTLQENIKQSYSPRMSQRVHSPRAYEIRGERSSWTNEKGLDTRQAQSSGPSNLGRITPGSSSHIP